MDNPLDPSDEALSLIRKFEGFSPYAIPDVDRMQIGYGHNIQDDEDFAQPMSQEDADDLAMVDLAKCADVINVHVLEQLNQNQFDALCSFVYNVGQGKPGVKDGFVWLRGGSNSTMLRLLNKGDFLGAANQLPLWTHVSGVPNEAILNRRQIERLLFLRPL